ncbi:MAG: peptidoglycan-binding protein, partial [Acidimicrobiia bacterium]|nr:peptidoglycan-binding protein [Acidimicrobiia bacterium]
MSRGPKVVLAAIVVLAVGAGAAGVVRSSDGAHAEGSKLTKPGAQTATVTRKDLAETQDVSGTLGYGATTDVTIGSGHGTVTGLAPVGTVVDRGSKLGEVDGLPVVLFFGDRPMWRNLDDKATTGPDIEELEANLIALGYGTNATLGPNETWSQATTEAVKRWQAALGRPQTGSVAMGDVVFQPGAVRIAEHSTGAGGGGGLKVTGTARVVSVSLAAKYQTLVKAGQPVRVELPDESTTPGTISSVGTVATAAQQGQDPTVAVVVTLNDQHAGAGLDQAPVTVHITTNEAKAVLAVPVGALLALAEGGYAVEKVTSLGTTSLVGVQAGTFADGWVQVT